MTDGWPRSRANIDHIAIAPSGVWVIDAKRYKGKIEVRKPLFRDAKLVIGGRDKSKLVDGLARQAAAVQSALDSVAPRVPVHACFCFVNPEGQSGGTKLPLLRTLTISGYPLLYPRKLAKRLKQPGDYAPSRCDWSRKRGRRSFQRLELGCARALGDRRFRVASGRRAVRSPSRRPAPPPGPRQPRSAVPFGREFDQANRQLDA